MRVLIITSMYPSAEKKYSGIFVKNQYESLSSKLRSEESIEIFFMRRRITGLLGSVTKHLVALVRFIRYLFRRYEVIHLHSFFPLIFSAWMYKCLHPKTKFVVTFHGLDINKQVNKKNQRFFRWFAKRIDFTIPVGHEVAKNVTQKLHLPVGKILPVGVNEKVFYKMDNCTKDFDYIFVGSFFEVKGIDILYQTLLQLEPSVRFCVVGKGSHYEPLFKELSLRNPNIKVKVDVSHQELRVLYNRSRFLVLPSRSEGFPTVTVEALFCGTPIITSDIPQFKEQVREGKNGFLFPLEQPSKLQELISNLVHISSSEYQTMVQEALASFRHISLDKVCDELLTIYRD